MNSTDIIIRDAQPADNNALTALIQELGYPVTEAEMAGRFEQIQRNANYKTLLALYGNEVAGMAGCTTNNYAYEHNGIYVRILAFVVSTRFRQKGIGRVLIAAVEDWARETGAHIILLNSGNREERRAAHEFYPRMGYALKSSGYVKKI